MGKLKSFLKGLSLRKEAIDNPVLYGSLVENRAAFVTGGTSGIGLAIAEALVRNGASVAITGRSESRLSRSVEEIRRVASNARVFGVVLDNSSGDVEEFERVIDTAERTLGERFDILVNNAGVISGGNAPNTDFSGYNLAMNTNLRGAYFLSQIFARRLVTEKRTGNILNVCSSSSLRPAISPYTLSKWGMRSMTMGFAKLLASHGIVVNGIAPGPTATPMLMSSGERNLINEAVPMGRYATPEEIANMAVVLVSPLARMVVGDIVYMTGGCGNLTYEDIDYTLRL